MDAYLFCFTLGGLGLVTMAAVGFGHSHSGGHHAAHGHGASGHGPSHGHHHADFKSLWLLASPRVLFSLLIGFGATGLLLRGFVGGWILLVLALLGAWLFERWLVQPIWNFVFRFASAPARTLEDALLEEARAVTDFDAGGHGLVSIELNGQVVQMLARLEGGVEKIGSRVCTGDPLSVVAVDPKRNTCTVSPVRRSA